MIANTLICNENERKELKSVIIIVIEGKVGKGIYTHKYFSLLIAKEGRQTVTILYMD